MGVMSGYSIQEVATHTGITVRSLRNYLRRYGDHLRPTRGACNALVFGEADLETFVKIRTLLREGKSRDEILALLGGDPVEDLVVRRAEDEAGAPRPDPARSSETALAPHPGEAAPAVPVEITALATQLATQNDLLRQLLQENAALRQKVDVLEVRLELRRGEAPQLPVTVPRKIPLKRGKLQVPLPYFMLRLKDGAQAVLKAVSSTFFESRPNQG